MAFLACLPLFYPLFSQESRKIIPGPDVLSEEVARASSLPSDPSDEGDNASSLTVRSVVHLIPSSSSSSSGSGDGKGETETEGIEREDEGEEEGVGEVVARGIDVELVAVLNPLSAAAQRASTLLLLVRKIFCLLCCFFY